MINPRISAFNDYGNLFYIYPEPSKDAVIAMLARCKPAAGEESKEVALTSDLKDDLFRYYSARFDVATPNEQDAIISELANANSVISSAVQGLLSIRAVKRARVEKSEEDSVEEIDLVITNRKPLPLAVQRFIIEEKLYLIPVKAACKRICKKFRIKVDDTKLSSAYQATGPGKGNWPARDVSNNTITKKEALARVEKKFRLS